MVSIFNMTTVKKEEAGKCIVPFLTPSGYEFGTAVEIRVDLNVMADGHSYQPSSAVYKYYFYRVLDDTIRKVQILDGTNLSSPVLFEAACTVDDIICIEVMPKPGSTAVVNVYRIENGGYTLLGTATREYAGISYTCTGNFSPYGINVN